MDSIIIQPKSQEDLQLFKQLPSRLNAPFKTTTENSPYDPEFVAKILEGDKDRKEGKGRKITMEELNDLWK